MSVFEATEETKINLKYRHAFSTDELRQTKSSCSGGFSRKQNEDVLTEITVSAIHRESNLTVIGQSDGKLNYWRPRRWNQDTKSKEADQPESNKLVSYTFDGHSSCNATIHALCYGMCDIMDPKRDTFGLIISGATDSKIKIWDPWHRESMSKEFPIMELDGQHNGTILCLKYANTLLFSGSTDCTVRIWKVYVPNTNERYYHRRSAYLHRAKLKQAANEKDAKRKHLAPHKRIKIAKSEPVANAFTHYFSNTSYFKKSGHNASSECFDELHFGGEGMKGKRMKQKDNEDQIRYPEMECQQIIKFDAWCRSICPSIGSGNGMLIADDNGILYAYQTTYSSKTMVTNYSQRSLHSVHSKSTASTDLEGILVEHNKTIGARSNVKTIYINDRKTAPVYDIEYYSKLHRLSIIHMLFVQNVNYVITLSSDFTLQVHDSVTCAAIFGVKNPENCKYTAVDYNYQHHELYVVDLGYSKGTMFARSAIEEISTDWNSMYIHHPNQFVVTAADCVEVWNIERIKRPKNAHGHEGDVIGVVIIGPCPEKEKANRPLSAAENMPNVDNLAVNPESGTTEINLSPEELENKLRNLNTVMYSAGIDNSIRAWDITTMSCRGKFENDGESSLSEISTLTYIPGTRALITGHHNGALYWWNTIYHIEGQCVEYKVTASTLRCSYKDTSLYLWKQGNPVQVMYVLPI